MQQYAGSGYKLLQMNGTCHFPMLENPSELNSLLQKVLKEVSADMLHNA
ncbi:MAG: hypothetical protein ABIR15_20845 [Chitinophagaceae bacterium]